jgi:hypothetical protein
MNKKFFIIGLTVLLGVSLFLTGCPTDADDYDSGNWYDGLASPTLTGIVLVKKDLTVPAGETLKIAAGGTLTVGSGGSIVVDAGGTLAGTHKTSQLVVDPGATVTGMAAGATYLWAATWLDEDDVKEAATDFVDELTNAAVDDTDLTKVYLTGTESISTTSAIPAGVTLAVPNGTDLFVSNSATLTVTGEIEVAEGGEITVDDGSTLEVAGTLTVAEGGILEVTGALEVDGTLDVAGTLEVAGSLDIPETSEVAVEDGGEYVLVADATGSNEGTITVKDGGSTWSQDVDITGDGVNVIKKGGKAYLSGTTAATRLYMIGGDDVNAGEALNTVPIIWLESDDAKLTFNDTTYRLDGEATLNGLSNGTDNAFSLNESQTLTIGENSTLTIPTRETSGNTVFWLQATDGSSTPRVLGKAGARIVLKPNSLISFNENNEWVSGDLSGKSWNNFYSNSETKETANLLTNKTYVWSTTLGSSHDQSGWVIQPLP